MILIIFEVFLHCLLRSTEHTMINNFCLKLKKKPTQTLNQGYIPVLTFCTFQRYGKTGKTFHINLSHYKYILTSIIVNKLVLMAFSARAVTTKTASGL